MTAGLDALKAALMFLGVKCGGTLQVRVVVVVVAVVVVYAHARECECECECGM